MAREICIANLDKAQVLAALYNEAKQNQSGFQEGYRSGKISANKAELIIQEGGTLQFATLLDKNLHVDISGNYFSPEKYEECNGIFSAQRAIDEITMP